MIAKRSACFTFAFIVVALSLPILRQEEDSGVLPEELQVRSGIPDFPSHLLRVRIHDNLHHQGNCSLLHGEQQQSKSSGPILVYVLFYDTASERLARATFVNVSWARLTKAESSPFFESSLFITTLQVRELFSFHLLSRFSVRTVHSPEHTRGVVKQEICRDSFIQDVDQGQIPHRHRSPSREYGRSVQRL